MRLWLATAAVLAGALPGWAQIVIYDSNPRIIQVPQSAVAAPIDNERVPRVERKPQPRRALSSAAAEAAPKPRAELPPPPGRAEPQPRSSEPKRALLNAPMPAYGPGSLTPIYPTPRWRNTDPPPAVTAGNDE
jgi:hypothetical protein